MTEKAVEWFQQDTAFVTPRCTQTNLELAPNTRTWHKKLYKSRGCSRFIIKTYRVIIGPVVHSDRWAQ